MSDVQAETETPAIPEAVPDAAPVVAVSLEPAVVEPVIAAAPAPVVDSLTDRIAALDAREAALEAREAEAAEKAAAGEAKQAEYESKLQGISEGVVHVLQQQADLAALIDAAHARDMAIKNAVADFVKATQ